jgi:hypothetical protein
VGTYKGKDSWLVFRCKDCEENEKEIVEIMIDPGNAKDIQRLGIWLQRHSNNGGHYETVVKKDMEIPEIPERPKQLQDLHKKMEEERKK